MSKKIVAAVLVLVMSLSILAGCSGGGTDPGTGTAPSAPSGGGEQPSGTGGEDAGPARDSITISLATELQTLDTYAMQNIVTNEVLCNIYETLLTLNDEGEAAPNVAESWEWDQDALKYTFKIKQGIKFHDGSELTANDVAFSFSLMCNEYASYQSAVANQVKDINVVDDYTVEVTLNNQSATFLYYCAIYVKMYCEAAYTANGGFVDTIVSCGPYKLVKYDSSVGAELELFEDYFGEIKPSIQKAYFNIIPDPNTQVVALENGELDVSRDFPASAITSIKGNENLDIYSHECGMIFFMMFNQRETGLEPFRNVKVRQAINYALDKESMIIVAEEGLATVANSIANKNMFGYSEAIPYYIYDVDKAKALMAEAGYPDGFEIDTIYTRDGKSKKVAEIAMENLKAIGITTTVTVLENNAYIDTLMNGNYNMASSYVNLNTDGDQAFEVLSVDGSVSFSGYYDEWLEEQKKLQGQELDVAKRFEILNNIFIHVAEEAYFAPIYYPYKSYAHAKGLVFNGYDKFVGMQLKFLAWE